MGQHAEDALNEILDNLKDARWEHPELIVECRRCGKGGLT